MLITMRGGATQGRSDRGRGQEIGGRSSRRGRGAGANTTPSRMDELLSPGILENGLEIHEFGLVGQEAASVKTAFGTTALLSGIASDKDQQPLMKKRRTTKV